MVREREVSGLTVAELGFPPGYVQPRLDPELPYLAFVLDGGLEKSFARRRVGLGRARAVTIPAGAAHGARFGSDGARVVLVKVRDEASPVAACLRRVREVRAPGLAWLAWRLAGELRATDAAAPLAAAGLALELLAAATRDGAVEPPARRTPAWLRSAEELLRTRACVGLGALAAAGGVHPTHLARAFRARHGMSVGEYGRLLRLEWVAAELARGDAPVATIAAEAGFSDQSHLTRLFARHVGTTPARYRAAVRGAPSVPG